MSGSSIVVPEHREPLRLRLSDPPGSAPLDGGWWPQSRSLLVELADLVDHFPGDGGRIVRAHFSRPDWEDAPARVPVRHGYVQTGSSPEATHVLELRTSDRRELCLLVIPPELTRAQGEEALRGAVTRGFAPSPTALLAAVAEL